MEALEPKKKKMKLSHPRTSNLTSGTESFIAKANTTTKPYVSMAEMIQNLEKKTPPRFHSCPDKKKKCVKKACE